MNKNTWERWKGDWEWILDIAKKRQWDIVDDLAIQPVVSKEEVDKTIRKLKIELPTDFIEIITNYSSGVNFLFQIEGVQPEGEYRQISSAGYDGFWSFENLRGLKEEYDSWLENCFEDPTDEYNKIWHNKTPIIRVATGDLIAFDASVGTSEFPVVYLSHDGGDFHGKRLGHNFIDFITRWSNIGCFGPEDWQLEPFHNNKEDVLELEGDKVNSWKNWLMNY